MRRLSVPGLSVIGLLAFLGPLLSLPRPGRAADLERLQTDLTGATAKVAKYEDMLAKWEHTRDFMVMLAQQEAKERAAAVARGEPPPEPFFSPDDLKTAESEVESIRFYISEAKKAEQAAQTALSQARQDAAKKETATQTPAAGETYGPPDPRAGPGRPDIPVDIPSDRTSDKTAIRAAIDTVVANRRQSGSSGPSGELSSSLSGASKTAQRLAAQLGEGVSRSAGGGPPGGPSRDQGPGALAGAGLRRGADSTRPLDPSRPASDRELQLAAVAGFKDAFARQGLRLHRGADGTVSILDRSGRPASADQLALLRRDIASQPAALMRYPEFFSIISPERFQGLKQRYGDKPEARDKEFKDIELKEDRDFKWDKSCDKVSGECNPHAAEGSYKKADFVPPRDLDSIWDEIEREEKKQDEDIARKADGTLSGSRLGADSGGGLLDRVKGAMSALWSSGRADEEEAGAEVQPDAGPDGTLVPGAPGDGAARQAGRRVPGLRQGRKAGELSRGPGLKWALRIGAVAAAGAVIFLGLRRRRNRKLT